MQCYIQYKSKCFNGFLVCIKKLNGIFESHVKSRGYFQSIIIPCMIVEMDKMGRVSLQEAGGQQAIHWSQR